MDTGRRDSSNHAEGAVDGRGQDTQFVFTVQKSRPATLALYNMLGQRVKVLYHQQAYVGQRHAVKGSAQGLPSGTYFVRLSATSGTRSQRIVVAR